MELRGYLRVIADRWMVIAAAALIGVLGGAAYAMHTPKTYTAGAKLFVAPTLNNATDAKSPTSVYAASQFVIQRIPSYTQLAGSSQVLQPVIRSLGLHKTVSQLAASVSVTNPTQSVILDVSVKAHKPAMAATLANAVAGRLATTIETLERANSSAPSPVVVTVTQHASVPSVPSSPKKSLDIALGLVLGIAVGLAIAVLRAQYDDTIKDTRAIREVAGNPPLALTRSGRRTRRPASASALLQTASSVDSLRVGLALTHGDELPAVLAVTAPVSHDGKAGLACSLAVTISRSGRKVCLVEADLREPTVDRVFGAAGAGASLIDVLTGRCDTDDALHDVPEAGLTVVSAGSSGGHAAATWSIARMDQFVTELAKRFDVVVIDTPPVLPATDALVIPRIADATVVVVRYGKTKRESLAECFNVLRLAGAREPSTVLVGMSERAWRKYSRHVADAHQRLRDQVVRPVPPAAPAELVAKPADHAAEADSAISPARPKVAEPGGTDGAQDTLAGGTDEFGSHVRRVLDLGGRLGRRDAAARAAGASG